MQVRRLFATAFLEILAMLSGVAADTADPWIAKARDYLGTERSLNIVKSLHFEGTVDTMERVPDPADPNKQIDRPISLKIDIVFQKPMQQRQILRSEKAERVTTLDGYDGWEKVSDRTGQTPSRITLLDTAAIKRLRTTTIENLSFYAKHDQDSRQVQVMGDVTVDGLACVKLSFAHSNGIVFLRTFEKATGRLILTEIEDGGEIREVGEMFVSGIRFPRKVLNKGANGAVTTITFEKVIVNESFPVEDFMVPSMQFK